jgi:hypothetical protein
MASLRCWRGPIFANSWGNGSSAEDIPAGQDFVSEFIFLDSEFDQAVIRRILISMEYISARPSLEVGEQRMHGAAALFSILGEARSRDFKS